MNKRTFFTIPSLLLLISCTSIPKNPFKVINIENKKVNVAVYSIRENGKCYDTDLSLYIKKQVENDIINTSGMALCARDKELASIIAEYEISLAGITSINTDVSLGRLVNADYVISGSIEPTRNGIQVELRMTSVASGLVEKTIQYYFTKKEVNSIKQKYQRSIPGDYYTSLVNSKMAVINKYANAYIGTGKASRVFVAIITGSNTRLNWLDAHIQKEVINSILQENIPFQKNILGYSHGFRKIEDVFNALSTKIYKPDSYILVAIKRETQERELIIYSISIEDGKFRGQESSSDLYIEINGNIKKLLDNYAD